MKNFKNIQITLNSLKDGQTILITNSESLKTLVDYLFEYEPLMKFEIIMSSGLFQIKKIK